MQQNFSRRSAIALMAFAFPIAALADISGTATLNAGQTENLDTGATVTSGGDITFTGSSLIFVGKAIGGSLALLGSGAATYNSLTQLELQDLFPLASTSPIPASSLPVGTIVGVETNGGNASKLLVTAISPTAFSFQYTTYESGSGTTPAGPTITKVLNNYSYIPGGFVNSGISPSTIFAIIGSDLATAPTGTVSLNSSAGSGLPTTSAGATVSVTVGGKTVTPGLYYALPTQIAGVLPAGTPTGTGTVTVSYNGATSNAFTIQVVPAALGLDTYYGTGSGLIVATNPATGALYTYTNSAAPGQTIVLWGSGLGADPQDSDTVFTGTPHSVNQSATQIWFGGVQGTVGYAGSSGYPGLIQINVTIPTNVTTGCGVSVAGVVNGVPSNFGFLPINNGGGVCSDPVFGINGTTISSLSGQTTVRSGTTGVGQLVEPPPTGTENIAFAEFSSNTGSNYASSNAVTSIGSCIVTEAISASGSTSTSTPLDAGAITLQGPGGTTYPLPELTKGSYDALLPSSAITSSGGTYVFTGAGGADVGKFTSTVNLPNPLLNWTNQSAAANITRSNGLLVEWTGGTPGSWVFISGSSSSATAGTSGSYVCYALQNALQFTVPSYVLDTLPAGPGTTLVENGTNFTSFTATGLDFATGFGLSGIGVNSVYQ
ncbi:MAG TPA: hypothetical protein VK419_08975 [Bryobacteraceae bacterium]|nr:hypothetical protein [Bryobacteraceae bacterium]